MGDQEFIFSLPEQPEPLVTQPGVYGKELFPFTGEETIVSAVVHLHPELTPVERIRTADLTEAWIANGMLNGRHAGLVNLVDGHIEVEVLGLGSVSVPLPPETYKLQADTHRGYEP